MSEVTLDAAAVAAAAGANMDEAPLIEQVKAGWVCHTVHLACAPYWVRKWRGMVEPYRRSAVQEVGLDGFAALFDFEEAGVHFVVDEQVEVLLRGRVELLIYEEGCMQGGCTVTSRWGTGLFLGRYTDVHESMLCGTVADSSAASGR